MRARLRAKRAPNGKLLRAPDRARELQAHDVRDGDEQHEQHGTAQRPQCRANSHRDLILHSAHDDSRGRILLRVRLHQL